jgi:O-methyltransferase
MNIMYIISNMWKGWFKRLEDLYIITSFIFSDSGREYGITRTQKFKLAWRIKKNNKSIGSLSTAQQHIVLVNEILRIPKGLIGDVVECGCYNGASTANLSIACALTKRRLFVCDSFEGLPKPREGESYDINPHSTDYYVWEESEFSSEGGEQQVRQNIKNYGNIDFCIFVKGFFNESLKDINTDRIVLIFEDADLRSSVEDCIRYLWPKLKIGCKFYSHEAWSFQVVSLFFDEKWWKDNLKTHASGFYGSGWGVPWGAGLGYAIKFDPELIKEQGKKIIHKGSKGLDV